MKLKQYFRELRRCVDSDGWRLTAIHGGQWFFKRERLSGGFTYERIDYVVRNGSRDMEAELQQALYFAQFIAGPREGEEISEAIRKRAKLICSVYRNIARRQYASQRSKSRGSVSLC